MKRLNKIYKYLFLAFPAVLYFSYFPVIGIGANETMNFELSLPLVYLVLFDIIAVILMISEKKLKDILKHKLWFLFPVFATISIIWSLNVTRGILTAGIIWAILIAGFSIVLFRDSILKNTWGSLKKVIYVSGGVAVLWCVVQCILDLAGVTRDVSLLCEGCVKEMFGFPHPNGFAIEPQFMGNLLIAPAMLSIYSLVNRIAKPNSQQKHSRGNNFHNRSVGAHTKLQFRDSHRDCCKNYPGSCLNCCELGLAILFAFGVFLTFSRGAIYAYIIGLFALVLFRMFVEKKKGSFIILPVTIFAFLFTLNAQGMMSAFSGLGETYNSGIEKVINHLSLGVIDLRNKGAAPEENNDTKDEISSEAIFDGYVAESTDTRMRLTGSAINIWKQDLKTIAFGVGLGGAGQALFNNNLSPAPKEIVQNEYASMLLETGAIGFVLFIFTIGLAFFVVWKKADNTIVVALMVAYCVTLFFFSGYPNALHIYLLPVMLATTIKKAP